MKNMGNKDMTFGLFYCEEPECENSIGYAGTVLWDAERDMKRVVCLRCAGKDKYKTWIPWVTWK